MPPKDISALPFLTREMLSFENGLTFALRVDMQSDTVATLALRGMTREATFEYKTTTTADSTITSTTFSLSDIPIYVTIEDTARAFVQGSCFIAISLMANGVVVQQLVSGYIYAQKALSWPNTQQVDLRPGGGKLTTVFTNNPAAGSAADVAVPLGEIWKIQAINTNLTTSSTVANRRVFVDFSQPDGTAITCFSSVDQPASLNRVYTFAQYGVVPDETESNQILVGIPSEIVMQPGSVITIDAFNRQAGDDFIASGVIIEKFFTTP